MPFRVAEAKRIVERLDFRHTLNHASWLNMAEIEFIVLILRWPREENTHADALPVSYIIAGQTLFGISFSKVD